MLKDVVIRGPVMVIDDIIATGGTLEAVGQLLTEHWGISPNKQLHAALIELSFLPGAKKLANAGFHIASIESY